MHLEHATHCARYPQLWPCDPGQILRLTGLQTFQCTDAMFQALQSWCSNQVGDRGNLQWVKQAISLVVF